MNLNRSDVTSALFLAPPARMSDELKMLQAGFLNVTVLGDPRYTSAAEIRVGSHRLPYLGSKDRWTGALAWLTHLRRVRWPEVDMVVSLELFSLSSWQAGRLARRLGRPHVIIVAQLQNSFPLYRLPPWRQFTRANLRGVATVIGLTNAALEHVIHLGVAPQRVKVVSPGVDIQRFYNSFPRVEEKVVLFAGRFLEMKGVLDAIAACDKVIEKVPGLRLVFVGDGPLKRQLEQAALTRPWVEVRARVPHAEMPVLLRSARVMVAPSYTNSIDKEQFGFSIVEASLAGLAIAATRSGSIPEVLPPDHPLVEERDILSLAILIERLLGDEGDYWAKQAQTWCQDNFDINQQGTLMSRVLVECMEHS